MAGRVTNSKTQNSGAGGAVLKQLVQTLRGDLSMLSNEAKKKYPAVREAAERSAMRLKTLSETKGFNINVLAETDDVVHPLLFACETKNPAIVKIGLTSLQKLIQYKAIPQKSVVSIVATLRVLMEAGVEELKVLQTVLLLITTTDVVQGKPLTKTLLLCFKMYSSRDSSVHNTAGVVIRQIVSSMFERLNSFMNKTGSFDWGEGQEASQGQLPTQASDAYLLFQDICFLTNGDPPAWLPTSLELELPLGLELLEAVLRTHPKVFIKEKLFNQLLTERVCPLVVKLFSPTSKYRHSSPTPSTYSPTTAAMLYADKPTFALSVRLLRILNVLIREFYSCLVTQCEIFLSMLVKFLDSDKPIWQRTLALEVLHSFCNQPDLLRSFCVSYDMQEHSSKIFGDIVDALGGFVQSCFTGAGHMTTHHHHASSAAAANSNSNGSHVTGSVAGSGRHMHHFSLRNTSIHAEALPPNAHNKPICLDMLDKFEVPLIPEGYPLVVAVNALLDTVHSVASILREQEGRADQLSEQPLPTSVREDGVEGVILRSSWSGVLAALALLLDACVDEKTTVRILSAHQSFIMLCGQLEMTAPRDAFLTSLCKAALPPRYTMSLIAQRKEGGAGGGVTKTVSMATSADTTTTSTSSDRHQERSEVGIPHHMMTSFIPPASSPSAKNLSRKSESYSEIAESPASGSGRTLAESAGSSSSSLGGGARRKLDMAMSSEGGGGAGGGVGGIAKEQPSALVTVKNLQCFQCLLQIIHGQGNLLDSAWPLIMNTLRLIVDIFGLTSLSGGGFKQSGVMENSSLTLLTVSKREEVSDIAEKLTAVFKSTRHLRDLSVLKLVDSLSGLLQTSLPGYGTKEAVTFFPIVALQEIGVANISRLEVVWKPITSHLSQACSHSDPNLRTFSAEALTLLIRGALEVETTEERQLLVLSPLSNLTNIHHVDVRLKQQECVSQVLNSSGQSLRSSWCVVLEVIQSATLLQSESLIRSGFQSLQLVIADFLPAIPHTSVSACVDMSGKYGLQTVDINISLTSIGLLWNMADYLFQSKTSLKQALSVDVFDSVWMLLFKHLSDLCVDDRAPVRKSASQTLFSTISAHGTLLQTHTWKDVLWKILFPLLEGVGQATGSASTSSFQTALLIHHSRNTAQKQWAETQVLTLTGSARLFQTRWHILTTLEGFEEAWSAFLDIIKECSCSSSTEVSVAAMKSFQIVANPQAASTSVSPRSSLDTPTGATPTGESSLLKERKLSPQPLADLSTSPRGTEQVDGVCAQQQLPLWRKAWETWAAIGERLILGSPSPRQVREAVQTQATDTLQALWHAVPSQSVLVSFVEVLLLVYPHLQSTFTSSQYRTMSTILTASLLTMVSKDVSPFLVPSHSEHALTSLHKLILKCLGAVATQDVILGPYGVGHQSEESDEGKLIHQLFAKRKSDYVDPSQPLTLLSDHTSSSLLPLLLSDLLSHASYTHQTPEVARLVSDAPSAKLTLMKVDYVPFGLSSQALAVRLYRACLKETTPSAKLPAKLHAEFLKVLHPPLKLRHHCSHPLVWAQSLESLLLVLEVALPCILEMDGDVTASLFWSELGNIFEDFLFSEIPEGMTFSSEKLRLNESWDIKVIDVIKKDILSAPTRAPKPFLEKLTSILNKGSIHTASDQFNGGTSRQSPVQFRETFARACFEALLQFSFIHSKDPSMATDSSGQLALNALLERCQEVLLKFVADERLSGSCPLPRTRMNEVSLVLKSVTILISALKDAQKSSTAKIDSGMWQSVTKLFPALVQCITCKSPEIRHALKDALSQFSDLLQPALT